MIPMIKVLSLTVYLYLSVRPKPAARPIICESAVVLPPVDWLGNYSEITAARRCGRAGGVDEIVADRPAG